MQTSVVSVDCEGNGPKLMPKCQSGSVVSVRVLLGSFARQPILEFLLGFDGRIHYLERGYWLKFEVKRMDPTPERPHGLRYSLTLHDPDGNRLMGFDNAHGVQPQGSRFQKPGIEHDHWHRVIDDEGRPYQFTTVSQLISDFFTEARQVLAAHGIDDTVVREGSTTDRRKP